MKLQAGGGNMGEEVWEKLEEVWGLHVLASAEL